MTKNTLYQFIQFQPAEWKKQYGIQVKPKKDQHGNNYFLFNLATEKQLAIQIEGQNLFTVKSHHVSIYEKDYPIPQKTSFSEYHYTAELEDEHKKIHLLHVYYNAKDQDVGLSLTDQANYDDFSEALISFATDKIYSFLRQLRKKQYLYIQQLEQDYDKLDVKASNASRRINTPSQKNDYLNMLNDLMAKTVQLNLLVNHTYYSGASKLLEKLKTSTTNYIPTPAKEIAPAKAQQTKPAAQSSKPVTARNHRRNNKKSQPKVNELSSVTQSIQELTDKIKKINITQVETLCKLYAECNQIDALTDFESASMADLRQLRQAQLSLEKMAKRQLLSIIQAKNTDPESREKELQQLKYMTAFHHLINASHLSIALQNGDHLLLDFLLNHSEFYLDSQEIIIHDKTYPNAVDYCLACDDTKINIESCFEVLIKHQASLMLPGQESMPAAYLILSNSKQRLHATLIKHLDTLLDKGAFYAKLHSHLRFYLHNHQPGEEQKKMLDKAMHQYSTEKNIYGFFKESNINKTRLINLLRPFDLIKDEIRNIPGIDRALDLISQVQIKKRQIFEITQGISNKITKEFKPITEQSENHFLIALQANAVFLTSGMLSNENLQENIQLFEQSITTYLMKLDEDLTNIPLVKTFASKQAPTRKEMTAMTHAAAQSLDLAYNNMLDLVSGALVREINSVDNKFTP